MKQERYLPVDKKKPAIDDDKPASVLQAKSRREARKECTRKHVKYMAPQHNHSGSSFV